LSDSRIDFRNQALICRGKESNLYGITAQLNLQLLKTGDYLRFRFCVLKNWNLYGDNSNQQIKTFV